MGAMYLPQKRWRRGSGIGLLAGLAAAGALGQMSGRSSGMQVQQKGVAQSAADRSSYALIPPSERKIAPKFALIDIDGKRLTLSAYRGRVVLLDFWAVDCGGCIREIPWYVEFDRVYRDRGLSLVGLDMYGETTDLIRPFMLKTHMDYPVAVGNDAIRSEFHAEELPMTLLIDRTGRIAVAHVGVVDKTKFEDDIQELLK